MVGDLRMTRRPRALRAATSPPFHDPFRATAATPRRANFSESGAWIPLSHTAITLLKVPWATWGPAWPFLRVHVRKVPGHLAEQGIDPQWGAGLRCLYLLIASRFSSMVSLTSPNHTPNPACGSVP